MNNLNWTTIPDIAGEKIIMRAVEQEYLDLYRKNISWQEFDRNFWIGQWMKILYKFGQVCPKWKAIVFGSKMLFEVDELKDVNDEKKKKRIQHSGGFHYLDLYNDRVSIYKGKRTILLRDRADHERF